MFKELKSISTVKKRQIGNKLVRSFAVQLAYSSFLDKRLHEVRKMFYRLACVTFFLLVGVAAYQYQGYKTLGGMTLVNYIIRFGPTIVILFLSWSLFEAFSRRVTFKQRLTLLAIALIASILYLTSSNTAFRITAFGLLGFFLLTVISIFIDTLISIWAEQRANRNYPQAIVTHNIVMVLYGIEKEKNLLSDLEFRKWCVQKLEYAATAIEIHIKRRLKTSDRDLNAWFNKTTCQIACSIREKKKCFYMPEPNTLERLTASLVKFLVNFLRNEWDSLEKADIPKTSMRDTWKTQLGLMLRTLIVGFLPIAILYFAQFSNIMTRPFNEYLISIAMLWALLNVLWAFDPSLRDKIGALKDTTTFIGAKSK
jgi:hypothetical protein